LIGLFDTGFLTILFDPKARVPRTKAGVPVVDRAQERIDFLVQSLSTQKSKIVIPTPVLSEFLLLSADRWNEYLHLIRRKAVFEIAGFDEPESISLVERCLRVGKIKAKQPGPETWAKVKFDQQIAAVAETHRVQAIYSTDEDLRRLARQLNIDCYDLPELPAPPAKQLPLKAPEEENENTSPPEGTTS